MKYSYAGIFTPGFISSCIYVPTCHLVNCETGQNPNLPIANCITYNNLPRCGYELIYSSRQAEALLWTFLDKHCLACGLSEIKHSVSSLDANKTLRCFISISATYLMLYFTQSIRSNALIYTQKAKALSLK